MTALNLRKTLMAAAFVAAIFFGTASNAYAEKGKYKLPVRDIEITKADETRVTVRSEIASRPEERNYGFMFRKKIPAGTGMLFVFEIDQQLSFWMKNTPTPLSIAYIDSRGKIVDIFDMTPYSLSSIQSTRSVRYALEVPQGWYAENGIAPGDRVTLP